MDFVFSEASTARAALYNAYEKWRGNAGAVDASENTKSTSASEGEEVSKKSSQDVAANSIPTPIIVYNIFFIVTCFLIIRLQIKIQHSNPP